VGFFCRQLVKFRQKKKKTLLYNVTVFRRTAKS
jgi:hypothetical protein